MEEQKKPKEEAAPSAQQQQKQKKASLVQFLKISKVYDIDTAHSTVRMFKESRRTTSQAYCWCGRKKLCYRFRLHSTIHTCAHTHTLVLLLLLTKWKTFVP